ncbi:hypothetical protein M8494_00410 [Serratia ureilytica]
MSCGPQVSGIARRRWLSLTTAQALQQSESNEIVIGLTARFSKKPPKTFRIETDRKAKKRKEKSEMP